MKRTIAYVLTLMTILFFISIYSTGESDKYDPDTSETESWTAEATLTIPQPTYETKPSTTPQTEKAPEETEPPLIRISRQPLPASLQYGDAFTLVIVIQNYGGNTALKMGKLSLEPSDGLILDEDSVSLMVKPLSPGDVGRVSVHMKVKKDASSSDQNLSVTYFYSYHTPNGTVEGQATEKLLIPVKTCTSTESTTYGQIANATPNIIVSSYDFGEKVSAGDTFTLSLQFLNTSKKITAENIVMSIEIGEGLSITNASNTYYYSKLAAQEKMKQTIPMRVSPNATAQGGRIEISFKYEYVDRGERMSTSAAESLSIPILIPDRFLVTKPETELIGMQFEEFSLSLPYVNKSRVDVSNVTAELIYDENVVVCEQPRLNIGNIEPGKSGTIDFFFTPSEPGKDEVTVRLTYENELAEEKSINIRVPFSVDPQIENYDMDGEDIPDIPEETSHSHWVLWVSLAAGVAIFLAVVLLVRRHKKKKRTTPAVEFDWDLPQAEEVKPHEDS